ncbi:MAG: 2-succinyl-5-enolpyruvyl-6-hydroxy-3-cyclohexene-1-carboxylic-acid synthase [Myxococcales bacterium]|nr:2-succinyl-5-enolpyruvyl-6-hydroxy-3-cyclohexene-1-carboxylic-acid synthase [Myxococcales bacterium]
MKTAAWNQCSAQHLVDTLAHGGVRQAVISPGSRNTPLILALEQQEPRVTTHVILDERTAAFFALGIARITREPVVLCCTSGSAAAHYLPAVIEASESNLPLIVLSADRPPELSDCGAPQTIDQNALYGTHVRWFANPGLVLDDESLQRIPTLAAQAIDQATGAHPGPVHLNLPYREPLYDPDLDTEIKTHRLPTFRRGKVELHPGDLNALVERCTGRSGIIYCGQESPGLCADPRPFAEAVTSLAQSLGWPVLAEPTSQVRFGHHSLDHVIAHGDLLVRDQNFIAQMRPDVVLRFGGAPISKPIRAWLGSLENTEQIAVSAAGEYKDPDHQLSSIYCADPTRFCEQWLGTLPETYEPARTWSTWAAAEQAMDERLDSSDELWEAGIARSLVDALPDGTLLQLGNSMPIRDVDAFAPRRNRNLRLICNRGANGIDGTMASLFGAAASWQGGPIVGLMGDLTFLHDMGSLVPFHDVQQPITLVVVDNGGGGIFEHLPIQEHPSLFERCFLTPQTGQIEKLCAGLELTYRRVDEQEAFTTALRAELERPGISILHVPIDRQANLRMHRELWDSLSGGSR